jgi:glycosyltransferase involved in cell wall biosynthesis
MNSTTSSPKVSVIIPTYNRSHFLQTAIESVLNQTYQDFELIVVDDGSIDETQQLLAQYQGKLQAVYQENQGRSLARNTGAKLARGKYLAFLDSDDVWKPTKLAQQIAVLEADPTITLAHCFTEVFDSSGQVCQAATSLIQTFHQRALKHNYHYEAISLECTIFTSCIVVNKEIFLGLGGFDRNLEYLEDWDFYLRLALNYKITAVPEPLVLYRHHDDQSKNIALTKGRIQVCQKHYSWLKNQVKRSNSVVIQRNFSIQLGECYFILGNHAKAQQWLWNAFQLDPTLTLRFIWNNHWLLPHLILSLMPPDLALSARKVKQLVFKQGNA